MNVIVWFFVKYDLYAIDLHKALVIIFLVLQNQFLRLSQTYESRYVY